MNNTTAVSEWLSGRGELFGWSVHVPWSAMESTRIETSLTTTPFIDTCYLAAKQRHGHGHGQSIRWHIFAATMGDVGDLSGGAAFRLQSFVGTPFVHSCCARCTDTY